MSTAWVLLAVGLAQRAALGPAGAQLPLPSPCLPAGPGLACCCYDCYGNYFNVFCSSEMLRLALFGWEAA